MSKKLLRRIRSPGNLSVVQVLKPVEFVEIVEVANL